MSVLILSTPQDAHAAAVSRHLQAWGHRFEYLSAAEWLQDARVHFDLHSGGMQVVQPEGTLDPLSCEAIWLRRPDPIKSPALPQRWIELLVESESNRALAGIWRTARCLWVNHPAHQEEALLKVQQLDVARRCQLMVPETVITNDPERAGSFFQAHNGNVIYKLVDERSWVHFPATELSWGLPTMPVREADLPHLDQVKHCLHLFQRRIDKVADIRVTAVGAKLFAARIESQVGQGKLDFRLDYSVPMAPYELPSLVASGCLSFMRKLKLNFAAFDFCLAADGSHYFLEANPAGQFLWIEEALDMPISLSLAELLTGRMPPLV